MATGGRRLHELAEFAAAVYARYLETGDRAQLLESAFYKIAQSGKVGLHHLTSYEIEALPMSFLCFYEPQLVTNSWYLLPPSVTALPAVAELAPCDSHHTVDGPPPAKRDCATCRLYELYHRQPQQQLPPSTEAPQRRKHARKSLARLRPRPAHAATDTLASTREEVDRLIYSTLHDETAHVEDAANVASM